MTYDAIVIGAGPGGYPAAIRLGQLGKKVAVVEREELGGVCLNWGCIPSKALIAAAHRFEIARESAEMGILADNVRVDLDKMRAWKNMIVKQLTGGVGQLLKANKAEVIRGSAKFVSPNEIEVEGPDGKKRLSAKAFVIATGGRPVDLPAFRFGEKIWSAKQAVDLPVLPKRLMVIGGGIIGLELGMVYAKLGSKVTVVEATGGLLPGTDPELTRVLERSLRKRKVDVFVDAKAQRLEETGGALRVHVETPKGPQQIDCDRILLAIGWRPNIEGLGLEAAGVKTDPKGFVPVDDRLRTNVGHIHAIGDSTGAPLLAHRASKMGEVAAEVIAGLHHAAYDVMAMPAAIFTDPEIATVGMSEAEAKKAGFDPIVGKFPFAASGRALSLGTTEGFVKVTADRESKRLLGVHIVGPEASEIISEGALALEMGASVEDIALTVHPHPTLPECIMEAAKAALGEAIHVINR